MLNQTLIPIMWQMVLIEKGTINPHVYWFFDGSSQVLVLPLHYAEVINCCGVNHDVTMVIYGGGNLDIFLEPLSKCYWRFSNIFIITIQPLLFLRFQNIASCDCWSSIPFTNDNTHSLMISLLSLIMVNSFIIKELNSLNILLWLKSLALGGSQSTHLFYYFGCHLLVIYAIMNCSYSHLSNSLYLHFVPMTLSFPINSANLSVLLI